MKTIQQKSENQSNQQLQIQMNLRQLTKLLEWISFSIDETNEPFLDLGAKSDQLAPTFSQMEKVSDSVVSKFRVFKSRQDEMGDQKFASQENKILDEYLGMIQSQYPILQSDQSGEVQQTELADILNSPLRESELIKINAVSHNSVAFNQIKPLRAVRQIKEQHQQDKEEMPENNRTQEEMFRTRREVTLSQDKERIKSLYSSQRSEKFPLKAQASAERNLDTDLPISAQNNPTPCHNQRIYEATQTQLSGQFPQRQSSQGGARKRMVNERNRPLSLAKPLKINKEAALHNQSYISSALLSPDSYMVHIGNDAYHINDPTQYNQDVINIEINDHKSTLLNKFINTNISNNSDSSMYAKPKSKLNTLYEKRRNSGSIALNQTLTSNFKTTPSSPTHQEVKDKASTIIPPIKGNLYPPNVNTKIKK